MRKVVLTLLILGVGAPCFAKYSGGTGDANTPYQIANAADLMTLANDANDYNKCFVMTADIDLAPNLPGNQTFTTAVIARDISNTNSIFDGNAFNGVFDGAGHKISNLTINTNSAGNDYLGLFGDVNGSEIKNLGLKNVSVTGEGSLWLSYSECIGGLVGYNGGSISNCYSTGTVSSGTGLGGLVGYNAGSISNCNSAGTVSSGDSSSILGGLVGYNKGTINNCYSTGTVGGGDHSQDIGGLVGDNGGSISDCYSTGAVGGGYRSIALGGLVGFNNGGSINGCYASGRGNVTGGKESKYLGGLVGDNGGSISDCYSTGPVSGSSPLGGLVGSGVAVSGSYFLAGSGPSNGYGTPLTDVQMKQQASFVGWDFVWETANGPNDIWAICEGVSYPKLAWQFIAGDSDNDKNVDFTDFALLANKWMQADSNLYCGGADLTGDGKVDIADLAAFSSNWLAGL